MQVFFHIFSRFSLSAWVYGATKKLLNLTNIYLLIKFNNSLVVPYTPALRLDLLKTTSYPATKLPDHWETLWMKNRRTTESTARLDCQLSLARVAHF